MIRCTMTAQFCESNLTIAQGYDGGLCIKIATGPTRKSLSDLARSSNYRDDSIGGNPGGLCGIYVELLRAFHRDGVWTGVYSVSTQYDV